MSYIRMSIGGTLPGGEVWSVNPVFSDLSSGGSAEAPQALNEAATAARALPIPAALRTLLSTVGNVSRVRLEHRNNAGTLMTVGESAGAPSAGTTGANKPFQTSIVLSLRTGLAGGSRRGRLYWPCLGGAISATSLRLDNPTNTVAAGAMAGYLTSLQAAINTELEGEYTLAVRSPTLGLETPVTSVTCGDILDTQRRRRDKAVEDVAEASFPAE